MNDQQATPLPAPLLASLVDDLANWWHTYGDCNPDRAPWGVTGKYLPVGLSDAALVYIEHAVHQITHHVRREHEAVWRRLYDTLPESHADDWRKPALDPRDVAIVHYQTVDLPPHAKESYFLVHCPTGARAEEEVDRQKSEGPHPSSTELRERAMRKLAKNVRSATATLPGADEITLRRRVEVEGGKTTVVRWTLTHQPTGVAVDIQPPHSGEPTLEVLVQGQERLGVAVATHVRSAAATGPLGPESARLLLNYGGLPAGTITEFRDWSPTPASTRPLGHDTDDTCRCVENCAEDPATACGLSGTPHVHPDTSGTGAFGPCPQHPDAPGDL
jgi:hypothetical protein